MERYYKILGVNSSATREEIKKAYHAKLKALHPDKVHGTILEDTATFLSSEINDAYKHLMANINEGQSSAYQNNRSKQKEENIYVEGYGYLKYSLSNSIEEIKKSMLNRTGKHNLNFIDGIRWYLNPNLSENVKSVMNRNNSNYSMTMYYEGSTRVIVINKRIGNDWQTATFDEEILY